jgi:hypothetical protein
MFYDKQEHRLSLRSGALKIYHDLLIYGLYIDVYAGLNEDLKFISSADKTAKN